MASGSDSDESMPPLLRVYGPEVEPPRLTAFHQFSMLHEDLQILIFSFVTAAPFEDPQKRSPVTHVLPFVSKQVRAMCQSNFLWKSALERLVEKEPSLWVQGLLKLYACDSSSPHFVRLVHEGLQEPGYMHVFRLVVERYLRFTGPVFMMSGPVRLGELFGLHFFEPRYRLLIRQVMEGFAVDNPSGYVYPRNGEYPTFCYAHMAPFAPTTPACLVEVRQCTIHANGTADVMLMPVAFVWMETLSEAPNTGRLHFARCLRMGEEDSRALEERNVPQRHSFANPLIEALLQRENAPAQMRALLAFLVNEHGEREEDSDEDVGIAAD